VYSGGRAGEHNDLADGSAMLAEPIGGPHEGAAIRADADDPRVSRLRAVLLAVLGQYVETELPDPGLLLVRVLSRYATAYRVGDLVEWRLCGYWFAPASIQAEIALIVSWSRAAPHGGIGPYLKSESPLSAFIMLESLPLPLTRIGQPVVG
jgi:hypothetical protein